MRVIDFSKFTSGLVVTRSEHWNKERGVKKNARKELGVMTDKKFYADTINGTICYPVIHWEGNVVDSSTHPANVAPYRKEDLRRARWVDVDGDAE